MLDDQAIHFLGVKAMVSCLESINQLRKVVVLLMPPSVIIFVTNAGSGRDRKIRKGATTTACDALVTIFSCFFCLTWHMLHHLCSLLLCLGSWGQILHQLLPQAELNAVVKTYWFWEGCGIWGWEGYWVPLFTVKEIVG